MTYAFNLPALTAPYSAPGTFAPALRVYQNISSSLHFVRRAQERGLKEEVLEFILAFGTEFHRSGALHLTVLERDLPKLHRASPLASKARDWVVLISDTDLGITCYRRKNAASYLKKKSRRKLSEAQLMSRRTAQPAKRRY